MNGAIREAMDQPGIDRAKPDLVPVRHAVEKPLHLWARKHRIDGQACQCLDARRMACSDQCGAGRRTAAALPADHRAKGLAGGGIPDGDRLALVGDCDAGNLNRRSGLQAGGDGLLHRLPDAKRALLDPAGLWVFDADRRRAARQDFPGRRNEDRFGVRGALINGKNGGCHCSSGGNWGAAIGRIAAPGTSSHDAISHA